MAIGANPSQKFGVRLIAKVEMESVRSTGAICGSNFWIPNFRPDGLLKLGIAINPLIYLGKHILSMGKG
jgi:hypothetical protein